jgi:hypothetical protein
MIAQFAKEGSVGWPNQDLRLSDHGSSRAERVEHMKLRCHGPAYERPARPRRQTVLYLEELARFGQRCVATIREYAGYQ